jgi:hypothetical protein
MQEAECHAHDPEPRKVLLDLLVKDDAHKQQAEADEAKKPHGFLIAHRGGHVTPAGKNAARRRPARCNPTAPFAS